MNPEASRVQNGGRQRVQTLGGVKGDRVWSVALGLVLALGLALGLIIGDDYGVSTDEYVNVLAARSAAAAYVGVDAEYSSPQFLADHGPAYFILWDSFGERIGAWLPGWTRPDGRHLFNYGVFVLGVLVFFSLSRRVLSTRSAWLATILFATQPLLFGYAFINQKDIPFMILFMAAITAGLVAADRPQTSHRGTRVEDDPSEGIPHKSWRGAFGEDWRRLSGSRKIALGLLAVGCAAIAQDLLRMGWTHSWGVSLVRQAYEGSAPAAIQQIFAQIAVDAYKTPIELYLARFEQGYRLARVAAAPAMVIVLLAVSGISLPAVRRSLREWARGPYPPLMFAGVLLGLAVCVRQIGMFAGALVSLYILSRWRRRALPALTAYWLLAALITYVTWPYLWPDPLGRFWQSISAVTRFGAAQVWYRGELLAADNLPWHYFPTLASLELTETALALFLIGIPILLLRARSGVISPPLAGLLGAWIVVPTLALMLSAIAIYDNVRHMLFILPPALLLAGIGLDAILARLKNRWVTTAAILIVIAPGLLGILAMHPYEYAYFNSFIGGVSGASHGFETDHWCTSFREAMTVVNERAEPGATIVAHKLVENAKPFQRDDLKIVDRLSEIPGADYVLVCPGAAHSQPDLSGFALVHQVREGDAVFAEVWEREAPAVPSAPQ